MPHVDEVVGHWLRQLFIASRYQAINWTNADLLPINILGPDLCISVVFKLSPILFRHLWVNTITISALLYGRHKVVSNSSQMLRVESRHDNKWLPQNGWSGIYSLKKGKVYRTEPRNEIRRMFNTLKPWELADILQTTFCTHYHGINCFYFYSKDWKLFLGVQ